MVHFIKETDFPILGSNVSHKYFSDSKLRFLNSFLRHTTRLQFLRVRILQNSILWAFSLVWYLKGLCSFVLLLRLMNAELVSPTIV